MTNKTFESFLKNNLSNFFNELKQEWNNQDLKFPNQEHSLEKWLVIIMEEIGEIAKEVLECKNSNYDLDLVHKEIIQAITLLIRLRYSIYTIDFSKESIII